MLIKCLDLAQISNTSRTCLLGSQAQYLDLTSTSHMHHPVIFPNSGDILSVEKLKVYDLNMLNMYPNLYSPASLTVSQMLPVCSRQPEHFYMNDNL